MLLQQDCMQYDDGSQSKVKVTFTSTEETCTTLAFTICALNAQPRKVTACKKPTSDPSTSSSQSTQETK